MKLLRRRIMSGDIINEINAQLLRDNVEIYTILQITQREKFFCVKCKELVHQPVLQLHCGHSVCGCCIDGLKQTSHCCPGNTRQCLETNFNKKDHVVPAYYIEKQLQKVKVKCPNHTNGCAQILEVKNLKFHANVCEFRIIHGPTDGISKSGEELAICKSSNDFEHCKNDKPLGKEVKELVEYNLAPFYRFTVTGNDVISNQVMKTSTSVSSTNLLILIFCLYCCYSSINHGSIISSSHVVEVINVKVNVASTYQSDDEFDFVIEKISARSRHQERYLLKPGVLHILSKSNHLADIFSWTRWLEYLQHVQRQ